MIIVLHQIVQDLQWLLPVWTIVCLGGGGGGDCPALPNHPTLVPLSFLSGPASQASSFGGVQLPLPASPAVVASSQFSTSHSADWCSPCIQCSNSCTTALLQWFVWLVQDQLSYLSHSGFDLCFSCSSSQSGTRVGMCLIHLGFSIVFILVGFS